MHSKIIAWSFALIFGFMSIAFFFMCHSLDLSEAPLAIPLFQDQAHDDSHILPKSPPKLSNISYTMGKEQVVLLSYAHGDEVYVKNQNMLHMSALNRGITSMHIYTKHHLDPSFYKNHEAILEQPRGAGYWLWKPYFILKTMEMYPDNTIIIYSDSGVVMRTPITHLLEKLKYYDRIFVSQGKKTPLSRHLKKEAQIALNIHNHPSILNAENLWAFFMIFRNTPENRDYVKKWLHMCSQKDLLTDTPFDAKIQDQTFEFHQHDQSLLSVVEAQHAENIPHNNHAQTVLNHKEKTLIIPKNKLRKDYGIHNFHRHPEEANISPLFLMTPLPSFLQNIIWNNPFIIFLRKIMVNS